MNYADIRNPRKHRLLCSVTGAPADDAHHIVHKGAGGRGAKADGDPDDATPLCRFVHDLHHSGGHITFWRRDGLLMYRCDAKGAAALRRRGVQCHEGQDHNALYEGRTYDDPCERDDPDDEFLAEMHAAFAKFDGAASSLTYERNLLLHRVREAVGKPRYMEWAVTTCGLSKSLASRACTIIEQLGERAATMPESTAYQLSRGVKMGKFTADEAVALLANSSLHDILEKYEIVKPRKKREPVLVCSSCGWSAPLSDYERSPE